MNLYLEQKLQELSQYLPPLTKQEDFDDFWQRTIAKANAVPLNALAEEVPYTSPYVSVYSITYQGMDDTPIYGWYITPKFLQGKKVPCVIRYHGLGGNRAQPNNHLLWPMHGMAVLAVECRDQSGLTRDFARYTSGLSGNVTLRGILDKEEYYFTNVYMDCLKALDFACTRPEVDPSKLILDGGSQGGALVSAISALDDRPFLAMADVPSNSDIAQRVVGKTGSFGSVQDYLCKHPQHTDRVLETLSYFDTMNMADKITCPTLASVGLKDTTCPAQQYFATYNRIHGEKQIALYPFNGHEGGGNLHTEAKLRFVMEHLA